jgi:hypothetical protein
MQKDLENIGRILYGLGKLREEHEWAEIVDLYFDPYEVRSVKAIIKEIKERDAVERFRESEFQRVR